MTDHESDHAPLFAVTDHGAITTITADHVCAGQAITAPITALPITRTPLSLREGP